MDKVFKIQKNDLVNNFKIACEELGCKDIEINSVTDSLTYKAIGKGMQWGTNAVIKVVFTEKEGFTNASFEILKEIRFPKFGKQKLAEKFYKEIIGLVEVLSDSTLKTNQSFNDTKPETNTNSVSNKNKSKIAIDQQISSSNRNSDSENIKAYLDKNKKQKNNKVLIFGGIFILIFLILIITQLSNSSSINACDCIEAMAKSKYEVYNKCIKQDYDKAFDYWESRDPNRKFEGQEAVIQAYWMEKCNLY